MPQDKPSALSLLMQSSWKAKAAGACFVIGAAIAAVPDVLFSAIGGVFTAVGFVFLALNGRDKEEQIASFTASTTTTTPSSMG